MSIYTTSNKKTYFILISIIFLLPNIIFASDTPSLDTGNTAWMITSTALVLFMTLPGLALFYGGLVRTKNILSILMQSFAIASMITLIWVVCGYSIAFDTTGMESGVTNLNSFIGGFGIAFLKGVGIDSLSGSIPETVFITFQMTFAIITPALITGAFAERMKFSSMLIFMGIWSIVVYSPLCHMAWSGGGSYFGNILGALDFAGGTVVHINAGIAALVAAIVLGPRKGFPKYPMPPHSLTLTVIGAAMLWVGWFGFNAGSALAADGAAGMAMLVTQIASASAALAWMFIEWFKHGKPSVLGTVTGAVAGLVAITPASGFVGPMGAIILGLVSGVACFFTATTIKRKFRYDDSLDVFGVHGVGGIIGAILTGVFASETFGGMGLAEGVTISKQVIAQTLSVLITIAYSGVGTYIILKILDKTIGLRVTNEEEITGLDISLHDENGYNY